MKDWNKVGMVVSAAVVFVCGALLTLSGIETGETMPLSFGLIFLGIGFVGLVVSFTLPD